MNLDIFETSAVRPISTHRVNGICNPANLKLGPYPRRAAALAMPAAAHFETLGFVCLITAVVSALPLVMMLHQ